VASFFALLVVLLASSGVASPERSLAPLARVTEDEERALAPVLRSGHPARRAEVSMTRASLGFLAGDAAAATVGVATFAAYLRFRGDDSGMGAIGPGVATAAAALVLPPLVGSFAASRSRGPASPSAVVLGGLAHVAGLAGAVALLVHDRPREAVGLMLAVDVTIAPWITARQLRRAAGAAEPSHAYALPAR
jgi:hypothetical protein